MAFNANNKGIVYLIPTPIADDTIEQVMCPQLLSVVKRLDYFIVENLRSARRFISALKLGIKIDELKFVLLNKHTKPDEIALLLEPVLKGTNAGIISEAGCPGVADPGALVVDFAHQHQVRVIPIIGPSSILLALMASGLNGQSFAFHGYLPIKSPQRMQVIKALENEAGKNSQTQIFMETPYRNNQLFNDLLNYCNPKTKLCVAKNVTGKDEFICTMTIKEWKNKKPELHKSPVMFLIGF